MRCGPEQTGHAVSSFRVPGVAAAEYEQAYAALAAFSTHEPSPNGERIEEIRFARDGVAWVAKVGNRLGGSPMRTRRRRGPTAQDIICVQDPATVRAIFAPVSHLVCAPVPYLVVTDAAPVGNARSRFGNPFPAVPDRIEYFDG